MPSFLEKVIDDLQCERSTLSNSVFVLPSKRAGTFLKNILAKKSDTTIFSPQIYSIESFIEKISGITYADNTQQLFQLYRSYIATFDGDKDNFNTFSKWGQTLIQDFNEIDRYLVDTDKIFSYLSDIQELNHWSLQKEKSEMVNNYIDFWNNLPKLYHAFNTGLLEKGLGHQGLVYRTANDKLTDYLNTSADIHHVFIGFNALNTAETTIIQEITATLDTSIYWDIDEYFLNDPMHDASYFIRKHKKEWNCFKKNPIKGVSSTYALKKDIKVIGIPKSVSQAKFVGQLLRKNADDLSNTAVVLGDETLMNPILNSIPETLDYVNVTMGYPLNKTPLASMFHQLLDMALFKESKGWYYKGVLDLLSDSNIRILLFEDDINYAQKLSLAIKKKNWTFIDLKNIHSIQKNSTMDLLFFNGLATPKVVLQKFGQIILLLKDKQQESALELEYLYRFYTIFNKLGQLVEEYGFINDIATLKSLYKELLSSETLDFQGEPLDGLQVMGMLESRNLDFETVIITSVNEGILPAGKSNNSFIPFDVKTAFGLPTYKEKDAVYTYHFYRLLQRAKNVYLLYNTEPDVLEGGEKSRLVHQLLTDEHKVTDITQVVAAPTVATSVEVLEAIPKDDSLMECIRTLGTKGFSPSSLSNYVRNPIEFYKKNILRISDTEQVEENVAHNTFGTIIHDTLEELYTPFLNRFLTEKGLGEMKQKAKTIVKGHFVKSFFEGDITRGKNYIAFNVVLKYVEHFINLEIKEARQHRIKIIALEKDFNIAVDVPHISSPVRLKGKVDRIDEKDGMLRIIDYKSGKVDKNQVLSSDFNELITDYGYSKAFQLLCYALMFAHNSSDFTTIQAGIFSFKNLKAGFLGFGIKATKTSRKIDYAITPATIKAFKEQLTALILEIYDPAVPFTEKEV